VSALRSFGDHLGHVFSYAVFLHYVMEHLLSASCVPQPRFVDRIIHQMSEDRSTGSHRQRCPNTHRR
jgi:hypothetical protein